MKLELIGMYLNCPEDVLSLNFTYENEEEENILVSHITRRGIPEYAIDSSKVRREQFIKDSDTSSIRVYLSVERLSATISYLAIRNIYLDSNKCYFRDKVISVQYRGDKRIERGMYNCVTGSICGLTGDSLNSFNTMADILTEFGYKGFDSSLATFTISNLLISEKCIAKEQDRCCCHVNFNVPTTQVRADLFDVYEDMYGQVPVGFSLLSFSRLRLTCSFDKLAKFFSKLRDKRLISPSYIKFQEDVLFIRYINTDNLVYEGIYKSDCGKLVDFPDAYRLKILNVIKELDIATSGERPISL